MIVFFILASIFWAWALQERWRDPFRFWLGFVMGLLLFLPTLFDNKIWSALFVLFWACVVSEHQRRNRLKLSWKLDEEERLEAERRRRREEDEER